LNFEESSYNLIGFSNCMLIKVFCILSMFRFFAQETVVPSPQISPISSNSNSNSNWSFDRVTGIPEVGNGEGGTNEEQGPASEMNTSITRRKLDFSFEESSGDESDGSASEYCCPRPGMIIHSPGAESFEGSSPRQSRIGMESPASTPIRG
jgi:hypothetical protein